MKLPAVPSTRSTFPTFSALVVLSLTTVACTPEAARDEVGALMTEGKIDAFQIRAGDCFNDDAAYDSEENIEVFGVAGMPCSEPHDNEVYASFDLMVEQFPGTEQMSEMAFEACLEYFEGFVGIDYSSSSLDIFPIYPTRESWVELNDREVLCALFDVNLGKLNGSVAGSGI